MYPIITDVSHWQGDIDFNKMKNAGALGVFIKSSEGIWKDKQFNNNRIKAGQAGLKRGYYHFLTSLISGVNQADYMWELIKDDLPEMGVVVDFEKSPNLETPKNFRNYLKDFLERMKILSGNKVKLIIYTGAFFWEQYSGKDLYWKQYSLWAASYTKQAYMESNLAKRTAWKTWLFWQFTDKGDGIAYGVKSKQLDLNYFNGTEEEFYKWCGGEPGVEIPNEPLPLPEKLEGLEKLVNEVDNLIQEIKKVITNF